RALPFPRRGGDTLTPSLPVDPGVVRDAVVAAAAAAILPRYKSLAAGDIRQKTGPNDLVTAADIECQAILAESLGGLLPGAAVVGEEGGGTEAEACAAIAAAEWCWVIDPLDGTHNFVHGRPGFSTMVALVHRGIAIGGWIHDPISRETQHAVRGQGAWSGSARLRVAPARDLSAMTGVLYIGPRRAPALHARLKQVADALGPLSFQRAAGAEYLGLAAGRIHYAIFTRLLPWDHAPGGLIFREAGGHMAWWDGEPYRADTPRTEPMLLAPDAETWRALRDFFGQAPA
ncbi:MAG: inositol monophosphatase, partial [Rhodospirillaceae bacterium]|nr:inositol monophosphatase [Rhodospirillaceae bacterium]